MNLRKLSIALIPAAVLIGTMATPALAATQCWFNSANGKEYVGTAANHGTALCDTPEQEYQKILADQAAAAQVAAAQAAQDKARATYATPTPAPTRTPTAAPVAKPGVQPPSPAPNTKPASPGEAQAASSGWVCGMQHGIWPKPTDTLLVSGPASAANAVCTKLATGLGTTPVARGQGDASPSWVGCRYSSEDASVTVNVDTDTDADDYVVTDVNRSSYVQAMADCHAAEDGGLQVAYPEVTVGTAANRASAVQVSPQAVDTTVDADATTSQPVAVQLDPDREETKARQQALIPTPVPPTLTASQAVESSTPVHGDPPAATVAFTAVHGAAPGRTAYASVHAPPSASCSLSYSTPAGNSSSAQGVGAITANSSGVATWSWKIGARTKPGVGSLVAICNGSMATSRIQIG
jgi:hypothetical protein